jgi:alanine dehydrogenase
MVRGPPAYAATIALGMGAQVTILDRSLEVLRRLATQFDGRAHDLLDARRDR